jgi:cytochrome d ubiquinol oxidase subunit II
MDLQTLWFVLVAVLWGGYFLLEGFDFGVGMLLPFLPRDEGEREAMFATIGPVWDGNEVWLVTAGGATFAAFPSWYATMFSGFYLALLVVLACLIVRVLSFEWRSRSAGPGWRAFWLWANAGGSLGAALIWGVALANLLSGVPLSSSGEYAGGPGDLFSPYTVLAGLAVVALFAFHGATFLTLRTAGDLRERAEHAARRLSLVAAPLAAAFLVATVAVAVERNDRPILPSALPASLGVAAVVLAAVLVHARRGGRAFAATSLATLLAVATLFAGLYPRVMVSHPDFAHSLTVADAASAHYTLAVMTVVALVFVPLVLLYQGWTYHVFRARIGGPTAAPAGDGDGAAL